MTIDPTLRDQLIGQAKKLAEDRGWTWREPVEVNAAIHGGEPVWAVLTNVMMRSPSARILFRRSDHEVVHAGYLPR